MPIIDGIMYCDYCGSDNCVKYPKAGVNAYKCLDCGSIIRNPIILNAVANETK